MLRLFMRIAAIPLLTLAVGALWLHFSDVGTMPSQTRPPAARAPVPQGGGPTSVAQPATPTPSPMKSAPSDAVDLSRLGPDLWRRLNTDARANSVGEWTMVQELSAAIRRQVEQLARRSGSEARP
ncbi:MAG: hypothetical protein ABR564_07050 [Candidatus Dormibacteria bacterium]